MSIRTSIASPSQLQHEKGFATSLSAVDEAAIVVSGEDDDDIDPEVADKLRRKIDKHILPLMMSKPDFD